MNPTNANSIHIRELHWATLASVSEVGKVRKQNEDRYLLEPWSDESAILAVVADGMGGNRGGSRAAEIAIDTFKQLLDKPLPTSDRALYDRLLEKFYQADESIRNEGGQSFQLVGMGATVVAAIITPDTLVHLYAGDSRLYRIRADSSLYKTADHSIIRILLEVGKITEDQIEHHPMRSAVNSCLGGREGTGQFTIDPKWDEENSPVRQIQNRDIILLSSDGLHGRLSDERIQEFATQNADNPQQFLHTLVQHALDTGGRDNLTGLTIYRKPNASPDPAETS